MMLQFWFLWLFIAIVVVIVAFTLRKERDDVLNGWSVVIRLPYMSVESEIRLL